MPKVRLEDVSLRSLPIPAKGQSDFWCDRLPGFGVRVSQGGTKTFVLNLHKVRRTIGRYPIISLSEARTEAKRMLAEKTLGKIRPQSISYRDAVEVFLEEKRARRKARTVAGLERHLNLLGFKCQLADVSHTDMERKLKKLPPSEHDHRLACAKSFFNWAVKKRYRTDNPVVGLSPYGSKSRSRFLADAELASIWATCSDDTNDIHPSFRHIVKLLIATGQRRGEMGELRTSYIEGDIATLPPEAVKNNHRHIFPLTTLASDILRAIEVDTSRNDAFFFPARGKPHKPFNAWSKNKVLLDKLCGVTGWVLHDLRRTFRTNLGKLGVAPHIAERLVNHISAQTDMEQTYDLYQYLPEMRAAIQLWETKLHSLLLPRG